MKNIFEKQVVDVIIQRINSLTTSSIPEWGTMNVAQMLAHCNVTYELVYDNKHPKPSFFMKLLLKILVKDYVTNDKPFKKNSGTAPVFKVSTQKDFELEKERLINYILQTQKNGASYFEGKESHSFGNLTALQWNNMFYKHLDHHLKQFGV